MLKKMTAVILALVLGLISCQAFALETQKDDNAVEPQYTLPTWAEALIFRMGQRNAVAQAGAGMRRRLLLCGLRFKRERQTARYGRVYVHGPGLLKEKRQRE